MSKNHQKALRALPVLLGLLLLGMVPIATAADDSPVKRMKRLNPHCMSEVDDHPCVREQAYRQEDYLAALSDKEIAAFEKLAGRGDVDAMFLLSQIAKETEDGKRDYKYREMWLPRAASAGHPIAAYQQADEAYRKRERIAEYEKLVKQRSGSFLDIRYLLAQISSLRSGEKNDWPASELPANPEQWKALAKELTSEDAYTNKPLTDEYFLELIESAALAQGSGEIAWRLAYSYYANSSVDENRQGLGGIYCPGSRQRVFMFLKQDPKKALHWARIAASRGNIAAAESLCNAYYWDQGNHRYGIEKGDAAESARWCTLAAQAMCSFQAAGTLSGLYRQGVGVPKSAVDSLYWEQVSEERFKQRRSAKNRWEYIGEDKK